MLKETLRSACRSACAFALAVSLTSDATPPRQAGQLPGVETPVQLKEWGSFTTRRGTRFYWYNYLNHTFNPVAAREMFSYFQGLVPEKGWTIPMVYRGGDQQAILFQREGPQLRALFITPENTPRSSTATINIPGQSADFMNRALATKACQQFIWIVRLTDSRPLDEQIADQAQEELCRYLGIAFAMRQKGPYDSYLKEVRSMRASFDYEPTVFKKNEFNKIPFVGGVIKSGN